MGTETQPLRRPEARASIGRVVTGTAGLLTLGLVLPGPATAWLAATTSATGADPTAPLVAVLALVAWILSGYVVLLAGLTLTGRCRGWWGRAARGTVRRIAPAALRQLMATVLGVGMLVGTAGGAAAAPGRTGVVPASIAVTSDSAGGAAALDWPTGSSAQAASGSATATPATPTPALEPAAASAVPSLDWPTVTAGPATPAAAAQVAAVPAAADPAGTGAGLERSVVVRPGDTLWSVAAAHLPRAATDRQIAAAWPSWWAANRDVVGADPQVLHPGQRLAPPAERT